MIRVCVVRVFFGMLGFFLGTVSWIFGVVGEIGGLNTERRGGYRR